MFNTNKASDGGIAIGGNNYGNATTHSITTNISILNNCSNIDSLESFIEDELKNIVTDISSGKIIQSIERLNKYKEKFHLNLSDDLFIKIGTTLGKCYLFLKELDKAHTEFQETYKRSQLHTTAVANNIISLMIKEEYDLAYNFGCTKLLEHKNNEKILYYTIVSAQYTENITNIDNLIPQELSKNDNIMLAKLHFLRSKNDISWVDYALRAYTEHSSNDEIALHYHESILHSIIEDFKTSSFLTLNKASIDTLKKVESFLYSRFKLRSESDYVFDIHEENYVINNLLVCTAYTKNKKIQDEIFEYFFREKVSSPSVSKIILSLYFDHIKGEQLEQIKNNIPSEIFNFEMFIHALNDYDYKKLAAFKIMHGQNINEEHIETMTLVKEFANEKINDNLSEDSIKKILGKSKFNNSKAAICELVQNTGFSELFLSVFNDLCLFLETELDKELLYTVSRIALKNQKFRNFIRLTRDRIHKDTPSEQLYDLTVAYTYDKPIREDAVNFFETLISDISDEYNYSLLAGTFYLNLFNLNKAQYYFEKCYQITPCESNIFCTLAKIYHYTNQVDHYEKLLSDMDFQKIHGPTLSTFDFIYVYKGHKKFTEALKKCYEILEENSSSEIIVCNYLHIFMNLKDYINFSCETVVENCYITYSSDGNDIHEIFISDNKNSNIFEYIRDTSDPFIKNMLGLKVNDTFNVDVFHLTTEHKITSIIPKESAAYKVLLEKFAKKFPHSQCLSSFNGDTERQLEIIKALTKQRHEESLRTISFYIENRFPINFIANIKKENVLELSFGVSELERIISFDDEIESFFNAVQQLSNINYDSIVLDAYTAFVCAHIDIIEILKDSFPNIYTSFKTKNYILDIIQKFGNCSESLSVSIKNDQLAVVQHTTKAKKEFLEKTLENLNKLSAFVTFENVVILESLSELEENIIYKTGINFFEELHIVQKYNSLFMSEDANFRNFIFLTSNSESISTWIQPFLYYLLSLEKISIETYSSKVLELIKLSHSITIVDINTLSHIYQNDKTKNLDNIHILLSELTIVNKCFNFHINTFLTFFVKEKKIQNCQKLMKVFGVFLKFLIKNDSEHRIIKIILSFPDNEITSYTKKWLTGHFIKI